MGQKQKRRRIRSSPKDFQKTRPASSARCKEYARTLANRSGNFSRAIERAERKSK